MKIVQVLLPLPFDAPFDYAVPLGAAVETGHYVRVPFGKRQEIGVVWSENEPEIDPKKIKPIAEIMNVPMLPDVQHTFIEWIANYTMAPLGLVLKMTLSAPQVFKKSKRALKDFAVEPPDLNHAMPRLSAGQQKAVAAIKAQIAQHQFAPLVLDGVTGSGKTEVYLSAMHDILQQGRQVLILMPEIALTQSFLKRFTARFGVRPVMWHSNLTPAKRRSFWLSVARGEAQVIVGARSALMLPYPKLGMIVVDEEHDPSYKQEEMPLYNARDMAVLRAKLAQHPVLLVSATPSLETLHNIDEGRYTSVHLPDRHHGAALPTIHLTDMRANPPPAQHWISPPLLDDMKATLERGEQVLLFLNRRGYAPLTLCRACGTRIQCPHCTAWMVEHKFKAALMCHHCGFTVPKPRVCYHCQAEDKFAACGPGVERIDEEVAKLFPDKRRVILASDTKDTDRILQDITDHKIDIVIGTQLIAKGHHFPSMTCIGVVDGDLGLSGADLRASERTFQLLHQVAGRAGREKKPGTVWIQTYAPEHPVMQMLARNDRDGFVKIEYDARRKAAMPPFGRLVGIIVIGEDPDKLEQFCAEMGRAIPQALDFRVLGPAPAPLAMLRGLHRRRCRKNFGMAAESAGTSAAAEIYSGMARASKAAEIYSGDNRY